MTAFDRTSLPLAAALSVAALVATPAGAAVSIDLAVTGVPTLLGAQAEEQFGYAAAAGDLDGDGALELVVGAPGHRGAAGFNAGGVYVIPASSLPAAGVPARAADAAAAVIEGPAEQGRFGAALAAGDLDGDGVADLVVGAPGEGEGAGLGRGRIHLFLSRPGEALSGARDADVVIVGETAGDALGSTLLVSDADGDGVPDLIASAPGFGAPSRPAAGAAYVVSGAALRGTTGEIGVRDVARSRVTADETGGALRGLALADTDGDGALELVLGAYQADGPGADRPDAGRVFVVPVARLATEPSVAVARAATTVVTGARERGFLGRFIAVGDVDGDRMSDLLVSAYAAGGETKDESVTGEAFVVFGGRAGIEPAIDLRTADTPAFRGSSRWDLFGYPVASSDLNADGVSDIVAAAQFADAPGDARARCGEVYVFWGGLRSVLRAKSGRADLADARIIGPSAQDGLGGSIFVAPLTGARRPDLVLGAPDAPVASVRGERCGKLFVVPAALLAR